ncbi:MAG: M23 family metallopeptidase [Candidatus Dojkabacteria bacterium]|nr:MAG: M23 family metallopeptidase [Candidatus Dojkabacteria bacterium]
MILVSGVYKQGALPKEFQALTPQANIAHATDVLVQNSSTKTSVSQEIARTDNIEYIVKGGDTLSSIATDHGINVDTIMWANELTSANVLKPGQKLVIPRQDGVYVKVKSGDTVASLAEKYQTQPQLIVEWNWLDPDENGNYNIEAGEDLFLPDGKAPQPVIIATRRPATYTGVVASPTAAPGYSNPNLGVGRFLGWPVANGAGYLSQCYSGWHRAIDIASRNVNFKPDIVASADGVVTFAGCQSGYCPAPGVEVGGTGLAWTVMVDHGNGLTSIYGHLNQIYVTNGQRVSTGEALGQMGRSGTAYGVHVHFVLVKTGTWTAYHPGAYMINGLCGY